MEPLTKEEFAEATEASARRQIAAEGLLRGEVADLRHAAGWLLISLAFWLLLAGWSLLRGGR